ncbi:MAG TPA: hypothetical protein VKZ18_24660 [Polyangia bacterium]|nr:hypothetical protein [Polyangia bacterium]
MARALRRGVLIAGCLLGFGLGEARAADVEGPEAAKLACVQRHEDAQVARRSGKLLAARAALLACSREVCPDAVRGDCVDWLEDVNRSVPSVVVTARDRGADVTDVKVFLDGELAATRLTGSSLEADPGEHHLRLVLGRGPVVERTILMSEGMRNRPIDVEFSPPPAPTAAAALAAPPPPPPPWRFADHPLRQSDYLFGGIALAGFVTGAALGIWAVHERAELAGSCGPSCTAAETAPLQDKLVFADVALGTAVVALAVGAYRYFTRAPVVASGDAGVIAGVARSIVFVGSAF